MPKQTNTKWDVLSKISEDEILEEWFPIIYCIPVYKWRSFERVQMNSKKDFIRKRRIINSPLKYIYYFRGYI